MNTIWSRLLNRSTAADFWRRAFATACLCGSALLATPARAQAAERFPVAPKQVLSAMQARQWSIDGVQVAMPSITSSVANPQLEVQSVSVLAPHQARLRVACRLRAECLPFLASVVWPERAGGPPSPSMLDGSVSGSVLPSVSSNAANPVPGSGAALGGSPAAGESVRPGSPATLTLEGGRIHISLQVVCLQSGSTGDLIRVASRDRKQTYRAEILTPTLLKGRL